MVASMAVEGPAVAKAVVHLEVVKAMANSEVRKVVACLEEEQAGPYPVEVAVAACSEAAQAVAGRTAS